ncbi:hypothetical protein ATANTOWER_010259 [Ataeniobius toweri]|uniref:Uncharacterized protein n=1 Tax=Ataeniobius toweri TaxID=208326 RepID=A0ABU7AX23_9TELE|nr:hypothetical protein [Ataeniobius toweri]
MLPGFQEKRHSSGASLPPAERQQLIYPEEMGPVPDQTEHASVPLKIVSCTVLDEQKLRNILKRERKNEAQGSQESSRKLMKIESSDRKVSCSNLSSRSEGLSGDLSSEEEEV